jgi:hypothetical protein
VRKWLPGIVVVVLIAAVAFVARQRDRSRRPQTPEAAGSQLPDAPGEGGADQTQVAELAATINDLFNAASEGDDDAYLRLVTGELRKTFSDTRKQLGREAFRESLKRSVSGIKGLATKPAEQSPPGFVAVDVEIIFADRNEKQRILLVEQRSGWAIASMERARMIKPPIKYGTPVFEEPLEAEAEGLEGATGAGSEY